MHYMCANRPFESPISDATSDFRCIKALDVNYLLLVFFEQNPLFEDKRNIF